MAIDEDKVRVIRQHINDNGEQSAENRFAQHATDAAEFQEAQRQHEAARNRAIKEWKQRQEQLMEQEKTRVREQEQREQDRQAAEQELEKDVSAAETEQPQLSGIERERSSAAEEYLRQREQRSDSREQEISL